MVRLRACAQAIRSALARAALEGEKVWEGEESRDPATGSKRKGEEQRECVRAALWPYVPDARAPNLDAQLAVLLREGGRFFQAAVLGGEPWRVDQRLELDGARYRVRQVWAHPTHTELLLEALAL